MRATETKQQFLRKLSTKIKNQEISEKEIIALLGKKTNSVKPTNKCRFCERKLVSAEPKESKKVSVKSTWEKELAKLSPREQKEIRQTEEILRAFDKVRIKH